MNYIPAKCDKCDDIVLIRGGIPLATCTECKQHMEVDVSVENFEQYIKDKKNLENVIGGALLAFKEGDKQYAYYVLAKIHELYPNNEAVAYQVIRVSGFDNTNAMQYLKKYCENTEKVPFAEDFLSACLTVKNAGSVDLFKKYINSKLEGRRKEVWLKKLEAVQTEWVKRANSKGSYYWMLVIMGLCIALNIVGMVGAFTFLKSLEFLVLFSIALIVVALEYGALYLHKAIFGNRTDSTKQEKVLSIIWVATAFAFFVAAVIMFFIGRFK